MKYAIVVNRDNGLFYLTNQMTLVSEKHSIQAKKFDSYVEAEIELDEIIDQVPELRQYKDRVGVGSIN